MHSNFFDEEFLFSSGTSFTEEEGPSQKTDDELRTLFEGNLNTLRSQTRVANSLFGTSGDMLNPEETPQKSLKHFIIDNILRKGLRGNALKASVKEIYGESFLKKNNKLISALYDHEWLQGNVFMDLSGYDNCVPISKVVASNPAPYILPCKSCDSCPNKTESSCSHFNKAIIPSVTSIDFKAYAKNNGFGVVSSKKELSNRIKNVTSASEKLNTPAISPNLSSENNINKKSSTSNNILSSLEIDFSKATWNSFKASVKGGSVQTKLKAFLEGSIRSNSVDFNRMFASSSIRELKPFYAVLKRVAEKYDQDYSIFLDEVSDYFDIEHIEKRIPTEEEASRHETLVRTVPQEDISKIATSIENLTWAQTEKLFPNVNKKKLMSFYVDTKIKSSVPKNVLSMFKGTPYQKVSTLLSSKDKIKLRNFDYYSEYFDPSLSDSLFNIQKRVATFDELETTVASATDELEFLKSQTLVGTLEVKSHFVRCLKTDNLNVLVKFVKENKVHSSVVLSTVNSIKAEYPKYKPMCNRLLNLLGIDSTSLVNFVKKTEGNKTSSLNGEALYNQVFNGSMEDYQEEETLDNEEYLSLEDMDTDGVSFD